MNYDSYLARAIEIFNDKMDADFSRDNVILTCFMTDDQEETIDKLISLWENGEIPAKVGKDVMKKSKVVTDVLELYYEIMKLVPTTYFEEHKSQQAQVDGEKQIVLSCYLKTGGK